MTSGGSGGVGVPSAFVNVVFDGGGTGSCTIDVPVQIMGFVVDAGYSGTIIQGINEITVNPDGATVGGGSFLGGSANMTVTGNFAVTGNAVFLCPSGQFEIIAGNFSVDTTATFNSNNGSIKISGCNFQTISGRCTFNALEISSWLCAPNVYEIDMEPNSSFVITGLLTIGGGAYPLKINTGLLHARGNISVTNTSIDTSTGGTATIIIDGTGDQFFTGSGITGGGKLPNIQINKPTGTLYFASVISLGRFVKWEYIQGNIDAATYNSRIVFTRENHIEGTHTLYNVEFYPVGGVSFYISNATELTVAGTLKLSERQAGSGMQLNGGVIHAKDSILITAIGGSHGSSATVILDGNGDQYIAGSSMEWGGTLPNVTIDKAAGDVLFSGYVTLWGVTDFIKGKMLPQDGKPLLFTNDASIAGGNNDSYMEGVIKKAGNDAFTFPVGKGGNYQPVGISSPISIYDEFTAEYFHTQQTSGSTLDTGLASISSCEYWNLERTAGTSDVTVTLGWNAQSCDIPSSINDFRVTVWDGAKWKNLGNGGVAGTQNAGTVITAGAANTFGAFTPATALTQFPGIDCANSLPIPIANPSCLDSITMAANEMWFGFTAINDAASIHVKSEKFGVNAPHIHKISLYGDSCAALTLIDEDELAFVDVAENLTIDATGLIPGNTYFLKVERKPTPPKTCDKTLCLSGTAVFSLCVRNVNIFIPPDGQEPSGSFIYFQNKGQIVGTDSIRRTDIKAYIENTSPAIYYADHNISYVFYTSDTIDNTPDTAYRFDMNFVNANPNAFVFESDTAGSTVNYFTVGTKEGVTNCKGYRRLIYPDIYNNIDFEPYSKAGGGEKNYFIVHPGGNLGDIMLDFPGVTQTQISKNSKDLTLVTPRGSVTFSIDNAFRIQPNGSQNPRNVKFKSVGNQIGFSVNSAVTGNDILVFSFAAAAGPIPTSIGGECWSTYLGSPSDDYVFDVQFDENNNIYACGQTYNQSFPVINGLNTYKGNSDGFIAKFKPTRARQWITFWGGTQYDLVRALTVIKSTSEVAFTGITLSHKAQQFPLQPQPSPAYFLNDFMGTEIMFIGKLNLAGNNNIWCTYFGDAVINVPQYSNNITSDYSGNIYIGGRVSNPSSSFPIIFNSTQFNHPYSGGGMDAFISKFNSSNGLLWSTFFGGDINDEITGMVTDNTGNLYVTGSTSSVVHQPLTPPVITYSSNLFPICGAGSAYVHSYSGGNSDAFIGKFDVDNKLIWSTMFGGNGLENGGPGAGTKNYDGIAVDNANGDIYIVGYTQSTTQFPVQPYLNAYFQPYNAGGIDVFIAKFNILQELKYATFIGGSDRDYGIGIAIGLNTKFITGTTAGGNFPLILSPQNYFQNVLNPNQIPPLPAPPVLPDAFLLALDGNDNLKWSTYIGGKYYETPYAISVLQVPTGSRKYVIGGQTRSVNYPIWDLPGTIDYTDISFNGTTDGFITSCDYLCIGCRVSDNVQDNFDENSETSEPIQLIGLTKESSIIIFPNPATEQITMKSGDNLLYSIAIFDMYGNKVFTKTKVDQKETSFSVKALSDGIYFVKILTENGDYSYKFIKN